MEKKKKVKGSMFSLSLSLSLFLLLLYRYNLTKKGEDIFVIKIIRVVNFQQKLIQPNDFLGFNT